MTDKPIFEAHNRYPADAGEPPYLTNTDKNLYVGYFLDEKGDQWLFTYDRTTKEAKLYSGSRGWTEAIAVELRGMGCHLPGLSFFVRSWADACFFSATGEQGQMVEQFAKKMAKQLHDEMWSGVPPPAPSAN